MFILYLYTHLNRCVRIIFEILMNNLPEYQEAIMRVIIFYNLHFKPGFLVVCSSLISNLIYQLNCHEFTNFYFDNEASLIFACSFSVTLFH